MAGFGNSPRRFVVLPLEARRSFAFRVVFRDSETGATIDMTGATLRFVMAAPDYRGGAELVNVAALTTEVAAGEFQFELQASHLDQTADEYPFVLTLVTSSGYSTSVVKGVVNLLDNADTDATAVYSGIDTDTGLEVYLSAGTTVRIAVSSGLGTSTADSARISVVEEEVAALQSAVTVLQTVPAGTQLRRVFPYATADDVRPDTTDLLEWLGASSTPPVNAIEGDTWTREIGHEA